MKLFKNVLNYFLIGIKNINETLMRGSDFIFDCVYLLFYKCNKINFKRGESYVNSPDWIKNKKATINPINEKDSKCFQ